MPDRERLDLATAAVLIWKEDPSMPTRMISQAVLAFALVTLVAITTVPRSSPAQAPKPGGRLVVGLSQDIPGLDPHPSTSTITYQVLSLVFQSLVDFDRNLVIRPVLAESWRVSPNGREWTFVLRKGVTFHNGRPLSAQDVKFTFERILDPKTAARGRGALAIIERVEAVDSGTVRFHLSRPSGAFLSRIAQTFQAIIPPEALAGDAFKPIGTGPYQLVEWKTNDRIELRRFAGYWEPGLPYLDELTLKPIPDNTVRLTALQTGDAGMIQLIPLERLAELTQAPSKDYLVRTVKGGGGFSAFILNTKKPPFSDARVRRAVAAAVDKQEVVLGVWRGAGQPINQLMPPGPSWFFNVPDRKADVEQAKRLLGEAGVPRGLKVVHTVGQVSNLVPAAQVFQAQLGRIGIDLSLEVMDWAAYIKRQRALDFTSTNTGFFPKGDPDDAYFRYFHSKGGANELSGGYANPAVDRLLEEAEATVDDKRRADAYQKAVEIIQDEVPMIITALGDAAMGWRTPVKGLEPHIIGILAYPGGGLPHAWLDR
jgi:peptide/nickel transport system substrate-binding protein